MIERPAAPGGELDCVQMNDSVDLRAEVLALLVEPLGVDATAGLESLHWLAKKVAAVVEDFRVASPAPSGSTLRWVTDAVAVCVEEHEIVDLVAAQGGCLAPDAARAIGELLRLGGMQDHLAALGGIPLEALRTDLATVALTERLLPGVVDRCRRADEAWPQEIRHSIDEIDIGRAVTVLRSQRPRRRRTVAVRERVLDHCAPLAQDLKNRDLATLLEAVHEFQNACSSYEAAVHGQSGWWRWLAPEAPFGFRTDRRDALLWAIEARDTGVVSARTLDMLADPRVRAVIGQWLSDDRVSAAPPEAPPAASSADRLVAGLLAVNSRTGIGELRTLESWYANEVELFDRVAATMDAQSADQSLAESLHALVVERRESFGSLDTSRSAYRCVQSVLRAQADAGLQPTTYSSHAIENNDLVEVISQIATRERELRSAVRALPPVSGKLIVAIAGRTKSGKTTLRKALTGEADHIGIGRGKHRTTRQVAKFDHGPVTFLDTPGFAAKDDDSDALTARAACDAADAVIWNYADTLRDEESAELERLLRSGKPLLVVVNVKQRVDTVPRLRRFAENPEKEFASLKEHEARIEQVWSAIGGSRPTVLAVHTGAAHEALSTGDSDLRDRAFHASRLPELEQSLDRLLAKRAVPLRAIRLADDVRAPLAALNEALTGDLPRIDRAIDELERTAHSQRAEILAAIHGAGQSARNQLEATRHIAGDRLSTVVPNLGGADHEQQWAGFIVGLELENLTLGLEREFEREMQNRGRVLRVQARTTEPSHDADLQVHERPDVYIWHRVTEFAKGAATDLLGTVAIRGIVRKLGTGASGGPTGTLIVALGYVLDGVSGGAKAVNRDVDRARKAMHNWTGETAADAEATVDQLLAGVEAHLIQIVDDVMGQVSTQFDKQSADIDLARNRFEQLRSLTSAVQSALDSIDLILARRLLALADGNPTAIRSASRTPGVNFRIRTNESDFVSVQAWSEDELFDVLTERLEICWDSEDLDAAIGTGKDSKREIDGLFESG